MNAILAQASTSTIGFVFLLLPWWSMWPPANTATIDGVLAYFALPAWLWEAFCTAMGDPGADLRLLAAMLAEMISEGVAAVRAEGGRRLTPVEAIQLGLVYRAAHRLVHLGTGGSLSNWVDPNPWEPTTSLQTSMARMGATSTTPSSTTQERKMKLSQVADQGDDSEFPVLPEANKASFYAKYVEKMGGLPADSEDPTIEQLSAILRKVKVLHQPPYCDFAVWVPFAKRHLKAQKYQSFVLQEDGTFESKMVPGPSCFSHWQASFRVLRTALVMTNIISLSNLMEWEALVERLHRQYPGCWGLVAAAEDRGRGEFMGKTLAKLRLEMDQGAPAPLGWRPEEPWNIVWGKVLRDKDYWAEQVHIPAISWTAKGSKGKPLTPMEEMAEASMRGGRQALLQDPGETDIEGGKRKNRTRREARKKRLRAEKEELQGYRKGGKGGGTKGSGGPTGKGGASDEACYAWNNGNGLCGGLAPGEACRAKVVRKHQCTVCHSPGHPSKECPSRKK